MKQYQTVYHDKDSFRAVVSEWQSLPASAPALIHLFSDGADPADISAACGIIDELMPDAVYVGASASGCLYDGKVSAEKLVVSCMLFEKPDSFAQVCFFRWSRGCFFFPAFRP